MRVLEISLNDLLRKIMKNHRKRLLLQEGLTHFQVYGAGEARKKNDVEEVKALV